MSRAADGTALGVSAQPDGVAVAGGEDPLGAPCLLSLVPPSVVGPHFPGDQPVVAGVTAAPPSRACGLGWAGRFGLADPSPPRVPLVGAWTALQAGGPEAGRAAEVIAAVVRRSLGTRPASRQIALVIPDRLREREQDYLLSALGSASHRISFVWRAVASGLVWCERFGRQWRQEVECEGRWLLAVHIGLDEVECSLLEIVPEDHPELPGCLPARPRPADDMPPLVGWGHELALRLASLAGVGDGERTPASADRLLWSTPWLHAAIGELEGRGAELTATERLLMELAGATADWPERVRREYTRWIERELGHTQGGPRMAPGSASGRLGRLHGLAVAVQRTLRERKLQLAGAIITGPFARAPVAAGHLGPHLVERCAEVPTSRCLLEAPGQSLLATGALLLARRHASGAPTYLDSLPRLETLVRRGGEPEWLNLLADADHTSDTGRYVPAGRTWNRQEDLAGLRLSPGELAPTFYLAMDGFAAVKRVRAKLPRPPGTSAAVRLKVSIEPARGSARVRIVSDTPSFELAKPILLDWGTMEDSGRSPAQVLSDQPRWFPPITRRDASARAWRSCCPTIDALLALSRLTRRSERLLGLLRDLRVLVRSRDTSGGSFATAVSSDGVAGIVDGRLPMLVQFCAGLLDRTGSDIAENALAILGYVSAEDPALDEHLIDWLRSDRPGTKALWIAAGNCLRASACTAVLIERLASDLQQHSAVDDRLMALERVLSYREDATARCAPGSCDRIARAMGTIAAVRADELLRGRSRWGRILPRSYRSIAMLLRRRRYEVGFLDPQSSTVRAFWQSLTRLSVAAKRGELPLIPGITTKAAMAAALEQVLRYLDGAGTGGLLLPQDDDSSDTA